MSYVVFTCRSIWKARCDVIFNSWKPSPSQIVLAISLVASYFLEACSGVSSGCVSSSPRVRITTHWSPPGHGVMKVMLVGIGWMGTTILVS